MHLGAVLVLVGTILVGVSLLATYHGPRRTTERGGVGYVGLLLPVGVLLIGIGVLVGQTALTT